MGVTVHDCNIWPRIMLPTKIYRTKWPYVRTKKPVSWVSAKSCKIKNLNINSLIMIWLPYLIKMNEYLLVKWHKKNINFLLIRKQSELDLTLDWHIHMRSKIANEQFLIEYRDKWRIQGECGKCESNWKNATFCVHYINYKFLSFFL